VALDRAAALRVARSDSWPAGHVQHANLSARVGPNAIVLAAFSQIRDLRLDDLAVVHLDGTVAEGDLGG
jgi:hypothetical protein